MRDDAHVVWVTTAIMLLLVGVAVWGFVARGARRAPACPLPPLAVAGAEHAGRVWTNNDPLLVVDADAADTWTGVDGDYDRIGEGRLEVGSGTAATFTPEVDEGPVDVFTVPDRSLLLVSVTAADAEDWQEFLEAVGRAPAREAGVVEVPSGKLAIFHASAPRAALTVVEGAASGATPFADEMLAISVPPGTYEVRESVVDAPSYDLHAWRLTRRDM